MQMTFGDTDPRPQKDPADAVAAQAVLRLIAQRIREARTASGAGTADSRLPGQRESAARLIEEAEAYLCQVPAWDGAVGVPRSPIGMRLDAEAGMPG